MSEKVSGAAGEREQQRGGGGRRVSASSSSSSGSSGSQTPSEEGDAAGTSRRPAAALLPPPSGTVGTLGGSCVRDEPLGGRTPGRHGAAAAAVPTAAPSPLRGTEERGQGAHDGAGQKRQRRRRGSQDEEDSASPGGGGGGNDDRLQHFRPENGASLEEQDEEVRTAGRGGCACGGRVECVVALLVPPGGLRRGVQTWGLERDGGALRLQATCGGKWVAGLAPALPRLPRVGSLPARGWRGAPLALVDWQRGARAWPGRLCRRSLVACHEPGA